MSALPRVIEIGSHTRLVHGRHGLFLCNANDIYVGGSLVRFGEFSELEWTVLQQICRPGGTVVEVGANIGSHTISIAKAVGVQGRVLAFEPQPAVFRLLAANVALNELYNVECFPMGLGARNERIEIPLYDYSQPGNFGGIGLEQRQAGGVAVEIRTLDAMTSLKRVDLMKLDVEGMETEVLRGAVETIRRCRPVLYLENDRRDRAPELIRLVDELGYKSWWHTPPLFNRENFFGVAENPFGKIVSVNMISFPREASVNMQGSRPVTGPEDYPLAPKGS